MDSETNYLITWEFAAKKLNMTKRHVKGKVKEYGRMIILIKLLIIQFQSRNGKYQLIYIFNI